MAPEAVLQKVLWALDPFEEEDQNDFLYEILEDLKNRFEDFEVQPLTVLAPLDKTFPLNSSLGDLEWMEKTKHAAEIRLQGLMGSYEGAPFLKEPLLVIGDATNREEAAKVFLREAERFSPDMILVRRHQLGAVEHFLKESFLESLVARSHLPILSVDSKAKEPRPLNRVVFSTDFGDHSKSIFRYVLELVMGLNAELTLFHSVPLSAEDSERRLDHQARRAGAWTEIAEEEGIETQCHLDLHGQNVEKRLGELCDKMETDLLVLSSAQPEWKKILRETHCPVLILPPDFCEHRMENHPHILRHLSL